MTEVLAIIPARKGSKGIPGKNIKPLAGKPLIAFTIESALKAKTINRVIVSTDGQEIAEVAKRYGAEVPFLRPSELAEDDVPVPPVAQHAVNYLKDKENYNPDLVVILQPTSPLTSTEDINRAVKKAIETGADHVASVCETAQHPFRMRKLEGDKLLPFIKHKDISSQRQDLPKVYMFNGAIIVLKTEVLLKQDKNYDFEGDWRGIITPQWRSIDIDTELDFFLAEAVTKRRKL